MENSMDLMKSFVFPDYWEDDDRMDSLFAPFRSKSLNSENYSAKLNFWRKLINDYCQIKRDPVFNIEEVSQAFVRKGKMPRDLVVVLDEMILAKDVKGESELLEELQNGWIKWAYYTLMKKPISCFVKAVLHDIDKKGKSYVNLQVLENHSTQILQILQCQEKKIFSFDDISNLSKININKNALRLCLLYLYSNKKVHLEFQFKNGQQIIALIKVSDKNKPIVPITKLEWSIYQLQAMETNLLKRIAEIETNLQENERKIINNLKDGKRILAKTYLRKKHQLNKISEKHIQSLENVRQLVLSLEESENNQVVLNTYKIGSKALKDTLAHKNICNNNVDDILNDVKETLEMHENIQQVLSENCLQTEEDDSFLDNELSELLATEEQQLSNTELNLIKALETLKVNDEPLPSTSTKEKQLKAMSVDHII